MKAEIVKKRLSLPHVPYMDIPIFISPSCKYMLILVIKATSHQTILTSLKTLYIILLLEVSQIPYLVIAIITG